MAISTSFTLTSDQLAERWGISAGNVRTMLRTKSLKGFKTGTRGPRAQWRVLLSEVERYEREEGTNE